MAINNINDRLTRNTTPPLRSAQTTAKQESVPSVTATDNVTTASLDKIKTVLTTASEAPVDSERVSSIKQAIAEGSYKVDADQVAKKLLQLENALSDTQPLP